MLDVKNIPASLKMEGLWCKYLEEDGKKKPINPKTNEPAKVNDSRTFGTFDEATRCIGADILDDNVGYGLGIFNPISAIDINDCVVNGKINDDVNELILDCNSYAEFSPSGNGIRIIFYTDNLEIDKKLYNVKNRKLKAEFICEKSNSKFLALTGKTINNLDIKYIPLDLILNKYFAKKNVELPEVSQTHELEIINFDTLNDTGYAKRFVEMFGSNLKYNFDNKCWMIWNGRYWQYDNNNSVKIMAELVAEDIRSLGRRTSDVEFIKQIEKSVSYLLSKRGKENMLSEAQHLLPISESQLDTDDYLLNTASGVLDLKNGKILKWDKEFYMSKYINIELEKKVPSRFMQFMGDIYQNNSELIRYVTNIFAYCLTGDIGEQEMYFFVGEGANGKSVLFELMNRILQDYSRTASADLLLDKAVQTNCKSELALLKGVRVIFLTELDPNQKLKMSMIKNMTGGNEVVACFKYKNEFTYNPKYKIMLATNHMPHINEDDNGSWRRIKKIDHNRVFAKHEQDKRLINKLYEERGAILNLLFQLCPSVLRDGLKAPDCVEMSVKSFRSSEDILSKWLEENTIVSNDGAFALDLFNNFRQYCLDNNEQYWYRNATVSWFGRRMSAKFTKTEVNRKKYYIGVKLR
jgi:putative DNA primase/helicase